MISALSSWFKKPNPVAPPASTEGALIYAIGDVHGHNDLLLDLLGRIAGDRQALDPGLPAVLVMLGDYIDRGPQSREAIDTVLRLKAAADFEVRALKGNHEHQMLLFLEGADAGPPWGNFGGRETLQSYGVKPPSAQAPMEAWEEARLALAQAVPPEHLALLQSLELTALYGDYVFVHAGLRPGVPMSENAEVDLLTIRDEFLNAKLPFEKVVVHGHTPQAEPQLEAHRIGIDTGVYATGRLTAVRLLNTERLILQAVA